MRTRFTQQAKTLAAVFLLFFTQYLYYYLEAKFSVADLYFAAAELGIFFVFFALSLLELFAAGAVWAVLGNAALGVLRGALLGFYPANVTVFLAHLPVCVFLSAADRNRKKPGSVPGVLLTGVYPLLFFGYLVYCAVGVPSAADNITGAGVNYGCFAFPVLTLLYILVRRARVTKKNAQKQAPEAERDCFLFAVFAMAETFVMLRMLNAAALNFTLPLFWFTALLVLYRKEDPLVSAFVAGLRRPEPAKREKKDGRGAKRKKKERSKTGIKTVSTVFLCACFLAEIPFGSLLILSRAAKERSDASFRRCTESGTYVVFGTYPQSLVTDGATLAGLNALEPEWTDFDDCVSGEGYYGTMEKTACMKYADAEYGGERYRAVLLEAYRPSSALDASSPAAADQDDNGYRTNTVYWFRYEPIRWIVLNGTDGLLLSEAVLDAMPFTDSFYWIDRDFSGDPDYGNEFSSAEYVYVPANLWKTSSVRRWLNGRFADGAFTKAEKKELRSTLHLADGSAEKEPYGFASLTTDKVFLLSRSEAAFYFQRSGAPAPGAAPTDYAQCRGAFCAESEGAGYSWWWLRSAGNHSGDAVSVSVDANVDSADGQFFSVYSLGGIRCSVRLDPARLTRLTAEQP